MILLLLLYSLIFILMVRAIKVLLDTRSFMKTAAKQYIDLEKQYALGTKTYEEIAMKINYLETFNHNLLNKLFEITQGLLLVKKAILEERY
ncbi:hypothetical protein [Bizionia sp. APA-3]|nr:hypothetical protein [Bizionia sp. APA-3]OBX22700.1 hypothetical protein BAA08_07760 [Bizionia sp. APA-3]